MIRFVVVDMDHTLCESHWRDHLVEGVEKTYENFIEYNRLAKDDLPNHDVAWLVRTLKNDEATHIVIATARPEDNRAITAHWLREHGIPYDGLLMREVDDPSPSPIFKAASVIDYVNKKLGVVKIKDFVAMVIDDRPDVLEAFRGLGVTTMQVRHGVKS